MKKELSKQSQKDLIAVIKERYTESPKKDRAKILDEFVKTTGCHRKHAIRLLNSNDHNELRSNNCGRRIYDEAVKEALIVLWEAADRICGKRLKSIIPLLVETLERKGHLQLDLDVRDRLLSASASTIDRILASVREQAKTKKKKRNAPKKASTKIPVRTFSDWQEPSPGELEIDFVAHCGGIMSGTFIHSLVTTDVCSGWVEAVPLLVREQSLTAAGLDAILVQFPMQIISMNTDNDSAFINDTLLAYCDKKQLAFTRSRAYQKNDQAWIEQKNGAVIRKFVGYDRFSGIAAGTLLAELYRAIRLYINYFQPSFKLLDKTRDGAKVKKRYTKPMTPADRLLKHDTISTEIKNTLKKERYQLDPIKLLHRIRELQAALSAIASSEYTCSQSYSNLDEFLAALPRLWRDGEVRPTHRKHKEAIRHWRTRKDPFEDVWTEILCSLAENPDATAKSLFDRLLSKYPGKFEPVQLRTLQRRIKEWRRIMANELVFGCQESVKDDHVLMYR